MSAPIGCDTERLVAYLYEEDGPAQRHAMDAHLAACPSCARELGELRGVRAQLRTWEAPPIELGFRVHREPLVAARRGWWPVPAWAQAAAAVLLLTIGAALANVDVRYGAFSLRIGWDAGDAGRASATPAPAPRDGAMPAAAPAGADAWRAELNSVAEQLRAEMQAASRSTAPERQAGATPAAADRDALLGQMRALVAESERRQQRELAFRLTQAVHDLERQRQNDLVRIEQTFGHLEGFTGAEAARQREMLNYLMRVSQPQR